MIKKLLKFEVFELLSIWCDNKNLLIFCYIEGEEEYLVSILEEGNVMFKFNIVEID